MSTRDYPPCPGREISLKAMLEIFYCPNLFRSIIIINNNQDGQDDWILASFLFREFMDVDSVSVHKQTPRKDLGQYPAILTSLSVNNPYIYLTFCYFEVQTDRILCLRQTPSIRVGTKHKTVAFLNNNKIDTDNLK